MIWTKAFLANTKCIIEQVRSFLVLALITTQQSMQTVLKFACWFGFNFISVFLFRFTISCTPGSAPGPMLDNEYGKPLPLPFTEGTDLDLKNINHPLSSTSPSIHQWTHEDRPLLLLHQLSNANSTLSPNCYCYYNCSSRTYWLTWHKLSSF